MVRYALMMLLALTMLPSAPFTSRAQDASPIPPGAPLATPASPDGEITTEALATISLPAAAIPPPPAIVDDWLWSLSPGAELTFATGEAPPSIAAAVVLSGEYSVRSEGRLQVQRAAGLEDVPPGTAVTARPGDAVIYIENQAAQIIRNPGDEVAMAISVGVFSAGAETAAAVSPEDWERSGLAGQDLTVRVERLTVPPGASLPAFVPDVRAPRIFAVAEGVVQWVLMSPGATTPRPPVSFGPNQSIWFRALNEGEQLQLRNAEDRPLVLLQVTISADQTATPVATPTS